MRLDDTIRRAEAVVRRLESLLAFRYGATLAGTLHDATAVRDALRGERARLLRHSRDSRRAEKQRKLS